MIRLCLKLSIVICLLKVGEFSLVAEEKIKLGVPLPLTGEAVTYGTDIKNSLLFANDKLVDGKYQLIFEDDRCNSKDATKVAHKLINIDKIKYAIGFACSSSILGPAPVYQKAGIVSISVGAASSEVSNAGEYIFRTYPTNDSGAKATYDYVSDKYKKIGIVSEETDFPQDYKRAFLALNSSNNLQVYEENYLPDMSDYRSILLRLKAKNIGAIVLNSQSEAGLIRLVQQLDRLKWDVDIVGNIYPSSPSFLKAVGNLAEGIVFNDVPFLEATVNIDGQKLYDKFVQEYGVPQSSDLLFVTTLVAFQALHQAIESGKDVKEFLLGENFSGVLSSYSFDENGDIFGLNQVLKLVKGGRAVLFDGS